MVREIILPKLGQTMEEGAIVEWFKQEGDSVERGDVLFTTESDKATLEVEAPGKGFLRKILVPAGELVPVLTVVGLITREADEDISGSGGESAVQGPIQPATARISEPSIDVDVPLAEGGRERIFASPRARKFAREKEVDLKLVTGTGPRGRIAERDVSAYLESLPSVTPVARRLAEQAGVDLRSVQGTGPGERITKADVARAIEQAETAAVTLERAPGVIDAAVPVSKTTPEIIGEVPMSGVRAVIAQRMHESHAVTAPVTLTIEVDATDFVALRERLREQLQGELGFNIGYSDLLIKLAAHALGRFPYMNAQLDQEAGTIRQHAEVHIALAVDTDRGLLVPVLRDADRKGLAGVARGVRDLVEQVRTGKALPDVLSGSTFTITNLGMFEIDAFTPIINLPETAILGVGRIKDRPAVMDGELCVRKIMWLSLTFDHRLVDGTPAARFLQYIKNLVEEPYLWLADRM
jgi:pyruvate dehydrogenase E2 component (dihydrolipoamide acetyltransferase)